MSKDAEGYINTRYADQPCRRYWVVEDILVGGSIVSATDWEHLRDDFGVQWVLSVESEHSDLVVGVPADRLGYFPFLDVGPQLPVEHYVPILREALEWAEFARRTDGRLYVHCQMGGSRSPAVAYGVLRTRGISREEAFLQVRTAHGSFGDSPHHNHYAAAVEKALK